MLFLYLLEYVFVFLKLYTVHVDNYINRFSNTEPSLSSWNKLFVQYVVFPLCTAEFSLIIFDSLLLLSYIFILSEHSKHLFYILYLTTRISAVSGAWLYGFLVPLINSSWLIWRAFDFFFFQLWAHVRRNLLYQFSEVCVPIFLQRGSALLLSSNNLRSPFTNFLACFFVCLFALCHSGSMSSNPKPSEEWTCSYHFSGKTDHLSNERQAETGNPPYRTPIVPHPCTVGQVFKFFPSLFTNTFQGVSAFYQSLWTFHLAWSQDSA